ncbi:MAG TPA: phosphatase PAP2 family protein [Steroidobacteraceae bacterium]|nr:phosphatase PAP2 family protein [Steroidobacteraceae bacterium]
MRASQWRVRLLPGLLSITCLLGSAVATAQTQQEPQASPSQPSQDGPPISPHNWAYTGTPPTPDTTQEHSEYQGVSSGLWQDVKDYYTAPLHWDIKDWAFFGGAIAAVAAAHHYDTQVRTHFIKQGAQPIGGSTKDLQDAVPALAAVAGTWLYAGLVNSSDGHREAWEMVEAGGLATVTSYALKFAAGRERPDQTSDPNKWGKGGSSFPSTHAAAAVAIGAVLAESGNDEYRWIRRALGYGAVAGFTAFERLKHNAHWLSDDVAGVAIGGATAHFILERNKPRSELNGSNLSVVPIQGGAMLTYSMTLD